VQRKQSWKGQSAKALMKSYHLLFVGCLLFLSACMKPFPSQGNFNAKLVASFCGFHIVEILDADSKDRGMDWTDPGGKQYKNVFAVKNHCDFVKAGLKVGDSFTAVIIDESQDRTCAVCYGYMETPPLQWNIRVKD
jgi:hypothetical protein